MQYIEYEQVEIGGSLYNQATEFLKNQPEHRESFLGGHFIETYQKCPWLFFLKYVLGFQSNGSKRYFIRGQALHSGIEYYLTHFFSQEEISISQYIPLVYLELYKDSYKEDETFYADRELVFRMMKDWLFEYIEMKPDSDNYKTVEVERQHIIPLSNGFPITVRIDRLVRSKQTGRLIVIDTKTTKNNPNQTENSMKLGNQGLSYLWAVEKVYNEKPAGVIVDILVGKQLKYEMKTDCYRSKLITFKRYDFIQWEMNLIGLLSELTQKVRTYYEGQLPPEFLFPRNPANCSFMGCPYADICRQPHEPNQLPPGYERDEWIDEGMLKEIATNRSTIEQMLYNMTIKKEVLDNENK